MLAEQVLPTPTRTPLRRMASTKSKETRILLKQFGKRLQTIRKATGFNEASEFAPMIGATDQAYRKYERGDSMPQLDVLRRIREVTNASLDFLLLGQK
jgi:ribosome-binding protein aMBF1 (putative translation factor)